MKGQFVQSVGLTAAGKKVHEKNTFRKYNASGSMVPKINGMIMRESGKRKDDQTKTNFKGNQPQQQRKR